MWYEVRQSLLMHYYGIVRDEKSFALHVTDFVKTYEEAEALAKAWIEGRSNV